MGAGLTRVGDEPVALVMLARGGRNAAEGADRGAERRPEDDGNSKQGAHGQDQSRVTGSLCQCTCYGKDCANQCAAANFT